jgi:hypothetical protein
VAGDVRSLYFLPLTFMAGVDGFALFAPYLALAVAATHLLWARRRKRERDSGGVAEWRGGGVGSLTVAH